MCGIAGMIDLSGRATFEPGRLRAMADAIVHRGPDEDGYHEEPGVALANRRLSIVGLADGRQPIANEDGSVVVVFNGELFDYPERKAELVAKGHQFRTHTDTELIPHLWEEHGEGMFEHLRGQFAICLFDRKSRSIVLARDRFGICPLFYSVQDTPTGKVLLFGSEIKALLASGRVKPAADVGGLMHVFTFVGAPGPATAFAGVRMLLPGQYLRLDLDGSGRVPEPKAYWRLSFPDWGSEAGRGESEEKLVDQFEEVLLAAVDRRLRADVPVVSYLSGGVDSSLVVALACKVLGRPIPTFTIGVKAKGLNEEAEALTVARHVGAEPIVVPCGDAEVRDTYPEMIEAAEGPAVDTACAAMVLLAKSVRANGYKVALTGEGADEWLAGYPWFKVARLVDSFGGGMAIRRLILRLTGQPKFSDASIAAGERAVGGHNGWLDLYGMMSVSKLRFFAEPHREMARERSFLTEIDAHPDIARWHPFHRALYLGGRVHLPGLLLAAKGDRPALHSSVETRYPFLDEKVVSFLCSLDPKWKLRGLRRDKYLLRKLALRWLPKKIALRRKLMFRAPMDSFHLSPERADKAGWIEQVLSPESLKRAGYFDPEAVAYWRKALPTMPRMLKRTTIEMGLVGVTATQLWHHLFVSGDLADIPAWIKTAKVYGG